MGRQATSEKVKRGNSSRTHVAAGKQRWTEAVGNRNASIITRRCLTKYHNIKT